MGKGPDVFFLKVFLGHLGRMHRRIVSVQNPGSWSQIWTFSSKNFLEHGQDLYNVGRVDPSAPGNVVLVYGALGVEECHYHLGAARGMDPGFDRPRSANGQPLLRFFFCFWSMKGYRRFVHCNDPGYPGRIGLQKLQEVFRDFHPFFLLLGGQKSWDPPGGLLYKTKIIMEDLVDSRG